MSDKLLFEMRGAVALLTFNRPDKANAMDLEFMQDLMRAAIRCDEDRAVRAVVVTGNGRFFSAGGDLSAFAEAEDVGQLLKEMTTYFHAAISRFARMNPPLIAAVNGPAAGAGFSFAAASDLVIAAESAKFVSAYTAANNSPDGSSTFFVPRLVGMRRAMELMLTNRTLSAAEALEWGLINRVVADDELMDAALELAEELAAGATLSFGAVKRLLQESFSDTLETQMEREARSIAELAQTNDGVEGRTAFFEKRKPNFTAT